MITDNMSILHGHDMGMSVKTVRYEYKNLQFRAIASTQSQMSILSSNELLSDYSYTLRRYDNYDTNERSREVEAADALEHCDAHALGHDLAPAVIR